MKKKLLFILFGITTACKESALQPNLSQPQNTEFSIARLSASCYSQLSAADLPTLSFPLRDWAKGETEFPFVSILSYGADWTFGTCGSNWKKHTGIDYVHPLIKGVRKNLKDTPVYAVYDGVVKEVYNAGSGWGFAMTIEHTYTYKNSQKKDVTVVFTSNYTHIKSVVFAQKGSTVKKGQVIGNVADISAKTTNHLHFTLRKGSYSNSANRGALPNAADASKNCECNDQTRTDAVFPEYFLNPSAVKFENKQI